MKANDLFKNIFQFRILSLSHSFESGLQADSLSVSLSKVLDIIGNLVSPYFIETLLLLHYLVLQSLDHQLNLCLFSVVDQVGKSLKVSN